MFVKNRIKNHYKNIILYEILTKTSVENIMEIPKLERIHLNFGIPKIIQDKKQILSSLLAIEMIGGQKAYPTISKKQVHLMKIRKGMFVGSALTLRDIKMYFFLNRLIYFVLPNLKNFEGFYIQKDSLKNDITFKIDNLYVFSELESEYQLFKKLDSLDVTLLFQSSEIFKFYKNLLNIILVGLQIPMRK
jgi:large subunit ribosomal protein L5